MGILIDRSVTQTYSFGMNPDDENSVNRIHYRQLGLGDLGAIQRETTSLDVRMNGNRAQDAEASMGLSTVQQMIATLRRAVTDWEGPLFSDDDGQPIRYRRTIWDDLNMNECEWWVGDLYDEIHGVNAARTTDPGGSTAPLALNGKPT